MQHPWAAVALEVALWLSLATVLLKIRVSTLSISEVSWTTARFLLTAGRLSEYDDLVKEFSDFGDDESDDGWILGTSHPLPPATQRRRVEIYKRSWRSWWAAMMEAGSWAETWRIFRDGRYVFEEISPITRKRVKTEREMEKTRVSFAHSTSGIATFRKLSSHSKLSLQPLLLGKSSTCNSLVT